MVYKYPICDVFHWFCKIARFFATEPLKLYQSSLFCKMRFFDTIATGGSSYLWLGCDKHWNCAVLAMAMVRLPTTSCWCLSIDTRYSTINELKRIASLYSTIFAQRKATKSMLWKL